MGKYFAVSENDFLGIHQLTNFSVFSFEIFLALFRLSTVSVNAFIRVD